MSNQDSAVLRATVTRVVQETPVTDLHTHLFPPGFGELMLWGVDELLTYHYLIAETLRVIDLPYADLWRLSKSAAGRSDLADVVPGDGPRFPRPTRGVRDDAPATGPRSGRARSGGLSPVLRRRRPPAGITDLVLKTAGVKEVVMTNDPFDEAERAVWLTGVEAGPALSGRAAPGRSAELLAGGVREAGGLGLRGRGRAGRAYAGGGAALPGRVERADRRARIWPCRWRPAFTLPEESDRARLIEACVLPVARERNLPFALDDRGEETGQSGTATRRRWRRAVAVGTARISVREVSEEQVPGDDAVPRESARVGGARAEVSQPDDLRVLVVPQQPEPDRGDDAAAGGVARHELRVPALRCAGAGSTSVQVESLPAGARAGARGQVCRTCSRPVGQSRRARFGGTWGGCWGATSASFSGARSEVRPGTAPTGEVVLVDHALRNGPTRCRKSSSWTKRRRSAFLAVANPMQVSAAP